MTSNNSSNPQKTRKDEKFQSSRSRENGENQARGDAVTECAVRRETSLDDKKQRFKHMCAFSLRFTQSSRRYSENCKILPEFHRRITP